MRGTALFPPPVELTPGGLPKGAEVIDDTRKYT